MNDTKRLIIVRVDIRIDVSYEYKYGSYPLAVHRRKVHRRERNYKTCQHCQHCQLGKRCYLRLHQLRQLQHPYQPRLLWRGYPTGSGSGSDHQSSVNSYNSVNGDTSRYTSRYTNYTKYNKKATFIVR